MYREKLLRRLEYNRGLLDGADAAKQRTPDDLELLIKETQELLEELMGEIGHVICPECGAVDDICWNQQIHGDVVFKENGEVEIQRIKDTLEVYCGDCGEDLDEKLWGKYIKF